MATELETTRRTRVPGLVEPPHRRVPRWTTGPGTFVIEVVSAVARQIGGSRVGIRLSPGLNIQDAPEPDPVDLHATYGALADGLAPLRLGYLSVVHPRPAAAIVQQLRARAGVPLVANTGFSTTSTRDRAAALVAEGVADAVAVGRPAIANPDLVRRWRDDLPETEPDTATFYTGGASGYTDYPTHRQQSLSRARPRSRSGR
ncbi:hypothetical protein [Plantactinospora sp. B24E8]|uniref:oxidoreductase n=1 Tax=Plantactinospora sp. B24E8 TaxID=3153567 RepID=UPI00325DA772